MAKGRVLVIDDELIICELLKDMLSEDGYEVDHALKGEDGVKKFQEGDFDIVMCDLKMPDIDGITVVKRIKEYNPESVIMVMTGYPSFKTVQEALRAGAFDYTTKPFNIKEMLFLTERAFSYRDLILTNQRLLDELKNYNIKLEEKVEDRTKELKLIYDIERDISSSLDLNKVLETILDNVVKILDLEVCSILLCDRDSGELEMRYVRGLNKNVLKEAKPKPGETISEWVARHKQAVLVEDIEKDSRFARKSSEKYYTHSFISVPLIVKDEVIGVINANNKKSKQTFTEDDLRFLKGVANGAAIAVENAQLYTSLKDTYMHTVLALASAVDAKDHYTKDHSENVTSYAVSIAEEMGLSENEMFKVKQASQLHDIGKIGIHDNILTKPGKLTDEEFEIMKGHPAKGAEILRPLVFLGEVIDLVEQHHERYDGKGYPKKLKGEEIKLGARIITAADSYDAMVTDRPYRKALSQEIAIGELKKGSGTQFDPKVVEAFLKVLEKENKSKDT